MKRRKTHRDGRGATGTILDNDKPSVTGVEVGTDADADSVVEGNALNFNVTLSEATQSEVTYTLDLPVSADVDLSTVTFSAGVSYDAVTKLLTVEAGVTDFTITVPTVDDSIVEAAEDYIVTVDGVAATGTILDNDKPSVTGVEVGTDADADSVVEGNALNFNVTLSEATQSEVTYTLDLPVSADVDLSTVTFSAGVSYDAVTKLLTVEAGVTDFTITVPTVDDSIVEAAEDYIVTVDGVAATGTILDNDKPSVTGVEVGTDADADSVVEGNALNFNVTLSEATQSEVTYTLDLPVSADVDLSTVTFSAGVSYDAVTKLLTVEAGVTDFTITVPTVDDSIVEAAEDYIVTVDGVAATGTILDNDKPSVTGVEVGTDADADSVVEGNALNFNVTLSEATQSEVTYTLDLPVSADVDLSTVTFSAGVSYDAVTKLLTVEAGVTDFTITVPTVDDSIVEAAEDYIVTVDGVAATGTILDNDKPSVTGVEVGTDADADSVVEGNALNFNVTLSEATQSEVTYTLDLPVSADVDLSTVTFSAGVSYDAVTKLLTVEAGVTDFTITVPTVDDSIVEAAEDYIVTVDGVAATGTILDNDKPSVTGVEVGTDADADSVVEGNALNFNVTLSEATQSEVTYTLDLPVSADVDLSTVTFSAGVSYDAVTKLLTVEAGVTDFTITVPTVDDSIVEAAEDYIVTVDGVAATGTILDNDKPSVTGVEVGTDADADSVVEGNALNFNVTLSEATQSEVTYTLDLPVSADVDLSTVTFSAGVSYDAVTKLLTVEAGVTDFTITVPTVDDSIVEAAEDYIVTVDGVAATGTILDNDKPSVTGVEVGTDADADSVVEGNALNFNVTLSEATQSEVTYTLDLPVSADVDLSTVTFSAGVSYDAVTKLLTVEAGVTDFTITVPTVDDSIVEAAEDYIVTVDGVAATGTILDNDKPSVTGVEVGTDADADSVVEGNALNFNVTLSEATQSEVTYTLDLPVSADVDLSTVTFSAGVSYDAVTKLLTVEAGVTDFTITVPTVDDSIVEAAEDYIVTVDGVAATGTILDNDKPSVTGVEVGTDADADSVVEGNALNFNVTLSEATQSEVTYTLDLPVSADVDLSTVTFSAGVSYDAVTKLLTVEAGVTDFTITVPTVDDSIVEAAEDYIVTVDGVAATGTILDNDKPSVTGVEVGTDADADSVVEGNALNFNVTLSEATQSEVTYTLDLPVSADVDLSTVTFSAGVSYDAVTKLLTVEAGVTDFTITVPTVDDSIVEAAEDYIVTVDGVAATGTILDNDKPSVTGVEVGTDADADSVVEGNALNFNVTLSEATQSEVTYTLDLPVSADVDLSTVTFSAGVSYDAVTKLLTVEAGVTDFTITVPTVDDSIVEAAEDYIVTVDGVAATGTILDNDKPSVTGVEVGTDADADSVVEGNALNFNVTLSEATQSEVTYTLDLPVSADVDLSTVTFSAGVSYDAVTKLLTVEAGVTDFTITVPTVDDSIVEAAEDYIVTVDGVAATGTILDNDKPSVTGVEVGTDADADSVVEGNALNFNVTLSEATQSEVTYTLDLPVSADVDLSTVTFSAGVSYDAVTKLLTVEAGVTDFTITVPTVDDSIVEAAEDYIVTVDGVAATGTILDNDKPSVTGVEVGTDADADSVVEGNALNFNVTLSEATQSEVTYTLDLPVSADVDLSTVTFSAGVSYDAVTKLLTVEAGVTDFTITVPTVDDSIVEAAEDYIVTVDGVAATGTILDNDKPSVTGVEVGTDADADSVVEGNALNFNVTLSEATQSEVTYTLDLPVSADVDLSTVTFSAGVSYDAVTKLLTVEAGVTDFTITVPTVDDSIVEAAEDYIVTVDGVAATGTILDNDKPSVTGVEVGTDADADSVVEGNALNFNVTLSEATQSEVTYTLDLPVSADVDLSTVTFSAGVSYDAVTKLLTVEAGVTDFTITVPTVDDSIVEAAEDYIVTVDGVAATGTILDNDKPSVTGVEVGTDADADSVVEGNALNFNVTLSEATQSEVTYTLDLPVSADVDLSTVTFSAGVSYDAVTKLLTVEAGVTDFTITVPTVDDSIVEAAEDYIVTVDGVAATGTILDNDKPSVTGVEVGTDADADSVVEGNALNFNVTLSEATQSEVTYTLDLPVSADVDLSTVTFSAGVSYDAVTKLLTVEAGVTDFTITVPTVDDSIVEAAEDYIVTVDGVAATGTILDNDKPSVTGVEVGTDADADSVVEGNALNFNVTLSEATQSEVTYTLDLPVSADVDLSTVTFSAGVSYDAVTKLLTVEAGVTDFTITVPTVDDSIVEAAEDYIVTVDGVAATGTILDNDKPSVTGVEVGTDADADSVVEGNALNFNVTLSEATQSEVTYTLDLPVSADVDLSTVTFSAGVSYDAVTKLLTVEAGVTDFTITVPTVDDSIVEAAEDYIVTVDGVAATGTILDNDKPSVTGVEVGTDADADSVVEGNALNFNVTLSEATQSEVTYTLDLPVSADVDLSTVTFSAGVSYDAVTKLLTVEAGVTDFTITVPTVDDSIVEAAEDYIVTVDGVAATGTILDNDKPSVTGVEVGTDADADSVVEGNALNFNVTLSEATQSEVTYTLDLPVSADVDLSTVTFSAGVSYDAVTKLLTVEAGVTDFTITVPTVDDSIVEAAEDYIVTVDGVAATGTILDNDKPSVTGVEVGTDADADSVVEGNALNFNVTLSEATQSEVTYTLDLPVSADVDLSTVTFSAGVSYDAVTKLLTVEAGVTDFTITVPTVDDSIVEAAEDYIVTVDGVAATGTILDNDKPSVTGVEVGTDADADSVVEGNALNFNVTLSEATQSEVTYTLDLPVSADVDLSTVTFSAGVSYDAVTKLLTVEAGVTDFTITVPTVDDSIVEAAEDYIVTVDGVAATGTILDNDKPSVTGVEVGTDADADSVVEGNALNFNVTLSEATQSEVTYTLDLPVSADVDLSTVTFSAGVSYDAVTKLLTVEAGVTDFTITVPTVDDSIVEAAEDYIVTVDGVAATGTILDNDKPSVTGVEVGTDADADSVVEGNALNFNVTLSEATQSEVTYTLDLPVSADVDLSTVTFSAGVSYDAVTKLLTVEAGVTDFTITVPTVDDSIVEAAEDYIVTVDGVAATGTILDNDKPSVTGVEVGTDADADSVVEGNALNFNVTLSEATQSEVTYTLDLPVSADVDLSTVTFSAGVSYDAVTKLLTVEAGVTDFTITVPTVDDSIVEAAEDYIVTVDGVAATGTILDNDKPSVTGVEVGTDADADSVVEGNALNFNVTLSEATQSEVTYTLDLPVSADVDLSTVTFSAGVSYDAVTKLLTVEAGVTDFTITVPTVDDSIVEAAEDYIVTVDGVAATGTILDNDKPSVTGVEVGTDADADSVVEGNALNFNVTLSEATQSEVTYTLDLPVSADVDLSTVTFSAGVSYDAVTKLLTVEAGVTDFTITVPTVDDSIVEAAEDYIVTVDGVAATGTILDNDKPSVTGVEVGTDADADSVVEGNALNFNVTLSEATQSEVTYTLDLPVSADVDLSTVTFSAGVSYDAVTKLLTVEAGVTDFTITVPTVDDSIVEAAEDYIVTVDGVAATGTILDNDKPSVTGVEVGTDADADSVVEGNALNFNVTLSEATQSEVTYTLDLPVSADVDLSTVTFSAGVSYDAVTKLLTVEAGVTDFTITVPTVDDSIVEAAEDYIVTVDGVAATGTILDNDKPSVTGVEVGTDADADSVVEGNALNFNVTLSEATQSEVTYTLDLPVSADVDLSTVTFSAGVSYDAVTKLLTVEAGVTDFTITVPTVDDSIVEAAEDYIVTVDGVAATGTILDNDKPSVTGVEVGTDADADSVVEGNALNFNVTLSEATQSEVTYTLDLPVSADVDLSTVTFSAGVSYDAVTKLLTVEAGVTDFTITVPTVDDSIVEAAEDYIVTVDGVAATGTILDNDSIPSSSSSHVVGTEDTAYTFKSSDFNVADQDSSNLTIVITSQPASGVLYYLEGNSWIELTGSVIGADGYEITQSEIDSGKLVFVPISDESSTSMFDDEGTSGNNLGDYTEFNFYASDGVNVSGGSTMSIDISAVADAPTLTVNSDNVTAAIDFDDTNYSGSWGSVNINQVFGPGTVGEWHSSNGNRVEVGRESTYRSGGDSTNTVLEIEYNNVDDVVYTDIDVEQGQYYSFSFDISGRDNSISNGNSDLNVVWINMDTGQETVLYEFRPNDEDWLRDQTVVLPSDVGGNYRLLLVSADTQASSSVGAILDNLEIVKADSQGFEDSFIALPDFDAALNDIDSSEVLSLSLSGLPIGTQITDGSVILVVTSNGGVDISGLDMDNLSVIVDVPGVYNYSITATATEVSNSDTASTTADLVLTVLELPQRPEVGTSAVRIAEEGLLAGLQDDIGITKDSDLTNNSSYSGVISLQDNNGDMLEVSLGEPTSNIYTSNGTLVEWSLSSDGQTLIGSANTDANNSTLNETIITVVIDDDGNYNVELSSGLQHDDPSGEDIMSFEIPIKASDGALTGSGSISIIVEDDSPESQRVHHDVVAETKSGANVQLVLDVSGSMKEDAGNGKSKLQVMKESTIQMLKQYESLGETRVQIVAFSDNSRGNQNVANYTDWISVTAAISYVNGLNAGGGTDYDDALWIANQTWDQSGRLSNASNISYFLSDGEPTGSDDGNSNLISQVEEGWWKTHLEQHDITAQSYGIGNNAPAEYLNPSSYDGLTDQDTEAIIVPDVTQLPPVLLQSLIQPIGGSLLSNNQGADDAVVSQIVIEGVTFNYNGSNVTSIGSNSSISYTFDTDTKTLTIYIDSKHSLLIDLDDGGYQFFGAADNKPVQLDFYYTVTDLDGDSSNSLLSFEIDGVNVVSDVKSEGDIVDHVRLNHYGHSSEELLWSQNPAGKDNQKVDGHQDGVVIDVGAAGDDVYLGEGDDTLYLGDSHTTLDNNANSTESINAANNGMKAFMSGGDLEHLQNPSDENSAFNSLQFSRAHIDVGHSGAGGDHVYGQGGVDIIYGASGNDVLDGGEGNDGLRGGSGEDRLTGGYGEDILIGGLGDDILTGGGDDDIFKFVDQDTSNSKIDIRNGEQDIITDFTKGEDKIDISELLHTDSNDTIDSLLQANKVDLTLEASDNLSNADLKLTINDGGNSQEVIIQGVGSQFSDYIESGSITNVSGLLNDIINIPDINN